MIFSVDSPSEDLADAAPKSREENRGGLWVSASMRVAASSGVWRRAFVRSRVSLRKPWLLQIERCAAYSPGPVDRQCYAIQLAEPPLPGINPDFCSFIICFSPRRICNRLLLICHYNVVWIYIYMLAESRRDSYVRSGHARGFPASISRRGRFDINAR